MLKQQLRLVEQKLDKLQKQTTANTNATAAVNAKSDVRAAGAANVNAAIPVKGIDCAVRRGRQDAEQSTHNLYG